MPQYRFVTRNAASGAESAEEYGVFNDEGALKFARRFGQSRAVEVWEHERLVGRVEPSRPLIGA